MEEWQGFVAICIAVVIMAFGFAACQVNHDREISKMYQACIQATEDADECEDVGEIGDKK